MMMKFSCLLNLAHNLMTMYIKWQNLYSIGIHKLLEAFLMLLRIMYAATYNKPSHYYHVFANTVRSNNNNCYCVQQTLKTDCIPDTCYDFITQYWYDIWNYLQMCLCYVGLMHRAVRWPCH